MSSERRVWEDARAFGLESAAGPGALGSPGSTELVLRDLWSWVLGGGGAWSTGPGLTLKSERLLGTRASSGLGSCANLAAGAAEAHLTN